MGLQAWQNQRNLPITHLHIHMLTHTGSPSHTQDQAHIEKEQQSKYCDILILGQSH